MGDCCSCSSQPLADSIISDSSSESPARSPTHEASFTEVSARAPEARPDEIPVIIITEAIESDVIEGVTSSSQGSEPEEANVPPQDNQSESSSVTISITDEDTLERRLKASV